MEQLKANVTREFAVAATIRKRLDKCWYSGCDAVRGAVLVE